MYFISAVDNIFITAIILEITKELFPSCTVMHVKMTADIPAIIRDLQPAVVWLQASPGNLKIAKEVREISQQTNFIFIASDGSYAYDAVNLRASGYMIEPVTEETVREELLNLRHPVQNRKKRIYIRCMGGFDVYFDGVPVHFSRSLSKDALAYLVHRKGFTCSISEICNILWGGERTVDTGLKSQCRVIMSSLKKDLAAVDADDILVKSWNSWSIDSSRITCDFYDYLSSDLYDHKTIKDTYLPQYPWADRLPE